MQPVPDLTHNMILCNMRSEGSDLDPSMKEGEVPHCSGLGDTGSHITLDISVLLPSLRSLSKAEREISPAIFCPCSDSVLWCMD